MIPAAIITQWRSLAPWSFDYQVEQDCVLTRALIELYQNDQLAESLLFRGGTALNKFYLNPAARYSEDIDLVQNIPEAIGNTFDFFYCF